MLIWVTPRGFIPVPSYSSRTAVVAPYDYSVDGGPLHVLTRASCERVLGDDGCVVDCCASVVVICYWCSESLCRVVYGKNTNTVVAVMYAASGVRV